MKKQKKLHDFLNIPKPANFVLNIIFASISAIMILPVIFVIIISLTSEESLRNNGYSFFPSEFSLESYKYIFGKSGVGIIRAFFVSVFVTATGTLFGTLLMSTYSYLLSRRNFRYRKFFTIVAVIPMLIGGGMVTNYLIMTSLLGLKNTLFALILPLAMSPFFLFVLRSFYQSFVPEAMIESAKVDGASELQTFFRIVAPIAKPGIATIALFLTLGYWNDWFNAMLYIDDQNKIPIQYMLIRIENTTQFLRDMRTQIGAGASDILRNMPADTMKMAIVVIVVLPIAMSYPFFQKYFVKGLTIGAVKE